MPEAASALALRSHFDEPLSTDARKHSTVAGRAQQFRANRLPAIHNRGTGKAPPIGMRGRYDSDTGTDGVDKRYAGRGEAAVMRHDYHVRTQVPAAIQQGAFGGGLDVTRQ